VRGAGRGRALGRRDRLYYLTDDEADRVQALINNLRDKRS